MVKVDCLSIMPQDYNSIKFLYQINSYAPTRDEINSTERMLMRFSVSMEIISFCNSGQSRIKKKFSLQKYMFCIHCICFPSPLLFYLCNLWIINWVHSYNFYLPRPYIFIIIIQYAYSRTFLPLKAMKYVLVFHHHYAIPGRIKRPPFRSRFSLGFTGRTTTTLLTRSLYIFIFP